MNILAVLSHPDDAEFLCGGTLLKYSKGGHRVRLALTTSGNIGSPSHKTRDEVAQLRQEEQRNAAALLGAEVRFLGFDDQLLRDTNDVRQAILDAIRWGDPDVILTNYPGDGSTDHAMTGELVGRVLLSSGSRLIPSTQPPLSRKPSVFYVDTVAGVDFVPEVYVDVTGELEQKLEALQAHRSQIGWMKEFGLDLADDCRTVARFRGLQAGCRYAEAFRMHRVHGFVADPRRLP